MATGSPTSKPAIRPWPGQQVLRQLANSVAGFGEFVQFTGLMFRWLLSRRPCRNTILPSLYEIGVRSVPVVAVTGTFIGMVLAVQAFAQFKQLHLENRIGSVINASLVTELGPVLAATMLAGRIGSAMAAEIGTMKVTEQVDALRCLGTDPVHYLVVPRFLACVLLIPPLTVIADFMGVLGGALVSVQINHVPAYYYWHYSEDAVNRWNLFTGVAKSCVFGAEIALVSCYCGFTAGSGAEGVGRAATKAFVWGFVAILMSDFFLGVFLNGIYDRVWPAGTMKL